MRNLKRIAAALIVLTAIAPVAMVATTAPAHAAKAKKKTIGAKVAKPLQEAQVLAQAGNFSEALAKAQEAAAIPGKTPYEEMVVQDFLAYLHVNLKDYAKAAAAAEAAFNTGQFAPEEKSTRLKNLAQLFYQIQDYSKAVTYAERYLAEIGPNAEMSVLIAQSHYVKKDYAKALQATKDIARAEEQAGRQPSEQLLQIMLSSAFRLKDGVTVKDTLFRLVELYPKPEYWGDLVSELHSQPGMNERFSLDVFRLQDAAGILTDGADFQEMAETALQLGLPGEAQRVLDKGFAAGVLGAGQRALQTRAKSEAAADKATIASQAAAVTATAKGDDDIKIAEAYESYGENAKALALVTGGLAKTGVKEPDAGRILLGRIQLNLNMKTEALATFAAVQTDPKYVNLARAWKIVANRAP